jgi:HAD superfamily hydrolase (TIGR01509 family)
MDGVIVDSEPRHEQAFREIFHEIGCGENHGIEFSDYLGKSDRALWLDFIERNKPSHTLEYLTDWKQRRFLDIIREAEPIFEDLPELVSRLGAKYKLGLASGSLHPVIDAVLAMKNLRQHFRAIVSVSDVTNGKPAPDIFLHAAELLASAPNECCVIEDSAAGVEAALAAEMRVIAITNSLPASRLSKAHHVVASYREIDQLLLSQ